MKTRITTSIKAKQAKQTYKLRHMYNYRVILLLISKGRKNNNYKFGKYWMLRFQGGRGHQTDYNTNPQSF